MNERTIKQIAIRTEPSLSEILHRQIKSSDIRLAKTTTFMGRWFKDKFDIVSYNDLAVILCRYGYDITSGTYDEIFDRCLRLDFDGAASIAYQNGLR